ncbi:TMV resistance protein N-like [Gossypium australe]|uniref:TMV resistance protein N-like n=1 Tax=Gossypium australe TaxID=47621 RepID=A0A5B6VTE1_9ROSI|nr:TMV resistance protein N-like [Gossypium australe]
MHGQGHKALDLYRRMLEEGLNPIKTTFVSLLSACSHSGLVVPGRSLFLSRCRNIDIGIKTSEYLSSLDATNPGIYINEHICRSKEMGCSRSYLGLIEVGKQLHAFFAGEDSHLNLDEINQILKNLKLLLEALGYMPDTIRLLHALAGSLIRITKNLRVLPYGGGDFHHFVNGKCSCNTIAEKDMTALKL